MAIGMTYEQYWYGDPLMVRAFYEADKVRQRRMNDEAWLYGAYVLRALEATVCNLFRKSGTPPATYPRQPVWEETQAEKRDEEQEAVWAEAYMANMVLAGQSWGKSK